MGIDVIRCWEYGCKDYNIVDDGGSYYFDDGQGCRTLWFPDYQTMKRFYLVFGKLSGRDSGLCDCCGCKGENLGNEFACSQWKANIIKFAQLGMQLKHAGSDDILILKSLGEKQARLYNTAKRYFITLSADHYKDDCLDGTLAIL